MKEKNKAPPASGRTFGNWPFTEFRGLHTAQMSVLMVFCGPHLPLALRFVCGPSGRFPFVWLRRRRRPRDPVQIVVFVGGPRLETIGAHGEEGRSAPN